MPVQVAEVPARRRPAIRIEIRQRFRCALTTLAAVFRKVATQFRTYRLDAASRASSSAIATRLKFLNRLKEKLVQQTWRD